MPDKQPITIQRGSFVCTLFDINNLMELPLANLRKLWKIMFSAASENAESIHTITAWLPLNVLNTECRVTAAQDTLQQAARDMESLCSTVAAFGSVATKEQKAALIAAKRKHKATEKGVKAAKNQHERAKKLQIIFNELTTN